LAPPSLQPPSSPSPPPPSLFALPAVPNRTKRYIKRDTPAKYAFTGRMIRESEIEKNIAEFNKKKAKLTDDPGDPEPELY